MTTLIDVYGPLERCPSCGLLLNFIDEEEGLMCEREFCPHRCRYAGVLEEMDNSEFSGPH